MEHPDSTSRAANMAEAAFYAISALVTYLMFRDKVDEWAAEHWRHLRSELKGLARERLVDLPRGGRLWADVADAVKKGVESCRRWGLD
jgi:hypothetical protein